MPVRRHLRRLLVCAVATAVLGACTPQIVAPYNPELQQKASAMQAEVGSWDLAMRAAAGTVAADPRNPDVAATLNRWQGEADAMLTLAVSNDPGQVRCSEAVNAVQAAIIAALPADLRAAAQANAQSAASRSTAAGCESVLVTSLSEEINTIRQVLDAGCKLKWIDDGWFATQGRDTAARPPAAPKRADQDAVAASCRFEFSPSGQANDTATAAHGTAVSRLLMLLQEIVYIETRKKASAGAK
jgi:hypothetical protein